MTPQENARHLRPLIEKAVESLDNSDAWECVELFEEWKAGVEYKRGKRLRYEGNLYEVRQDHTSQEQYPPSIYTASLYAEVPKPGQGDTPDNPIPYNNNMALEEGKYYSQFDVVYICTRSTGVAVYANLADLVGHYVEVYE